MSGWIRDYDPTRPIHYEGTIHYPESLEGTVVDMVSTMYPTIERIIELAGGRQALRALALPDQEVLGLHYYAGLAPDEIAGILGCSVAVVHKRLQRARERLRARIEGDPRGPKN